MDAAAEHLGFLPSLRLSGPLDTAVPSVVGNHLLSVEVSDVLQLVVRNDGKGLPPDRVRRSGLSDIDGRSVQLGGGCSLHTHSEGGAEVGWTVPLTHRASAPPNSR